MRYFIALIALLMCMQLSGHTKRALIICVNEQEDTSWPQINSGNDLKYVKKLLDYSGYNDTLILTGHKASKQGIVEAFTLLADRCEPGDLVYVHFSGHGQRMTDIDGDESLRNHTDQYDESWIPYDAYMEYGQNDRGEKHLSDDELNSLLTNIKQEIGPSGHILVVVDACHSGGSTRNDKLGLCEGVSARGIEDIFTIPGATQMQGPLISEEWLTLSACMDYQINVECASPKVGKLTYMLYIVRRYLKNMSNNEFMAKLDKMMNNSRFKGPLQQNPALTGCTETCDLKIFF